MLHDKRFYIILCIYVYVTRRLAERRKSEEYEESDAEVIRQTAVEAEDAWDAELQTFQPASRLTGEIQHRRCKKTSQQNDRQV